MFVKIKEKLFIREEEFILNSLKDTNIYEKYTKTRAWHIFQVKNRDLFKIFYWFFKPINSIMLFCIYCFIACLLSSINCIIGVKLLSLLFVIICICTLPIIFYFIYKDKLKFSLLEIDYINEILRNKRNIVDFNIEDVQYFDSFVKIYFKDGILGQLNYVTVDFELVKNSYDSFNSFINDLKDSENNYYQNLKLTIERIYSFRRYKNLSFHDLYVQYHMISQENSYIRELVRNNANIILKKI